MFFLTFYVFGSCFRTLAVILVPIFFSPQIVMFIFKALKPIFTATTDRCCYHYSNPTFLVSGCCVRLVCPTSNLVEGSHGYLVHDVWF